MKELMERSANQHHGNKCRNCGILSCQDQRFENWWPGLLAWIQSNILLVNMVSTFQPAQPTQLTWLKTKGSWQTPCHKPSPKSPFCNFCRFDFNHPQMVLVYGVGDGLYHPWFLLIIIIPRLSSLSLPWLNILSLFTIILIIFFKNSDKKIIFMIKQSNMYHYYHLPNCWDYYDILTMLIFFFGGGLPQHWASPIPARSAPTPAPRGMPPGCHSEPGCQTLGIVGADGPCPKHPETISWDP